MYLNNNFERIAVQMSLAQNKICSNSQMYILSMLKVFKILATLLKSCLEELEKEGGCLRALCSSSSVLRPLCVANRHIEAYRRQVVKGVLHSAARLGGSLVQTPPTHLFDEADSSTQNYWASDPAIESLQPSGHFAPSLSL